MNIQWRFRFAWTIAAIAAVSIAWQAVVIARLKQRVAVLEESPFQLQSTRPGNRAHTIARSESSVALSPNRQRPPIDHTRSDAFRPADTLRNRGMHDTESTLESMYWAINAGESKTLASLIEIPAATHDVAKQFYDRLPADSRAHRSMEEVMGLWLTGGIEPISGFEIISDVEGADIESFDTALKGDSSYRTVRLSVQWNRVTSRTVEQRFVFHNTGQGWLWVLTPELVSRVARFAASYTPDSKPPE